jgi:glycosyltransferase involved in cell wall biosynthesis
LIVTTSLDKGGAERFTSTLLRHLDREAVSPTLCVLRDEIGYPVPEDVPVHVLGYRHPVQLPWIVLRLRRLLARLRPDVVLSVITPANLVTGAALRGVQTRPTWIARMGTNPARNDGLLRSFVGRRVYPHVDCFVANSQGVASSLEACYPCSKGKVLVVRNPTDFEVIDELSGVSPEVHRVGQIPLLISVGRLRREKRVGVMLEAFARVRAKRPAILWICGDGPEQRRIESRVRRLKLSDSVRLLGFCRNPYALMRQADLFLLSSDYEGLPNALIEAQSLGLPAVSTRCPHGPDEIIEDGLTGLLTPVSDAEAMAESILRLLEDPVVMEEMSLAARASARIKFDVRRRSKDWQTVIERASPCAGSPA